MSKEIIIQCPNCNTVNEGKFGWFFNKTITCVGCHKQIDPRKEAKKVVTCEYCGNAVAFNTTRGQIQVCPICGKSLSQHAINETDVTCPTCHMTQSVKYNEQFHLCPICNTSFDVQQAIHAKKVEDQETATVVTVPENNNYVIWKHPQIFFPYASQVVIPEGYTGLVLYNGVCRQPFTPGNYLLSDSLLSQQNQLAAAVHNASAQVSVQIFFVRNMIDQEMVWTNQAIPVANKEGIIEGTLGIGGSISLRITDAKKFAEFVGYKNLTADDLTQRSSKLYEEVRTTCFNNAVDVFTSVVSNTGIHYSLLESQKTLYVKTIRSNIDRSLMEIGLQADTFSIDFIQFKEDKAITDIKYLDTILQENTEQVREYVERQFEWQSPVMSIHMKDDITKSADIVMRGEIKFFIQDEDQFMKRSEVKSWIKNGVNLSNVSKYCSDLVRMGTQSVLRDTLQPMIDDTNADIRDLTIYYHYISDRVQQRLSEFFSRYGLLIELFSMEEGSRSISRSLGIMSEAAEHKSEEQIKMEVFEFDQKNLINRERIQGQTKLDIDSEHLYEETEMTKHTEARAANKIKDLYTINNALNIKEQMERDQNLKHKDWNYQDSLEDKKRARQDYLDDKKWEHQTYTDEKYWQRQNELEDKDWRQHDYVTDQKFEHDTKMTDISNTIDENKGYHYINSQSIDAKASEDYKEWEAKSQMENAVQQHHLGMEDVSWQNSMKRAREKSSLLHELKQGDVLSNQAINESQAISDAKINELNVASEQRIAQSNAVNEQIINTILNKIALSDLDVQEKRAAFERIIKNQEADDELRHLSEKEDYELRHTKESADVKVNIAYASGHVRNLLTQEENEILDDMEQRKTNRDEQIENARFIREMKRKERETAILMDQLKMEYDHDHYVREMDKALKEKDYEIYRLKLILDSYERINNQDLERFDIQETQKTARINAEYEFRKENEREKREYEQQKEQNSFDREEVYAKRADELLKRMMDIQSELQKYSLGTERYTIQQNADLAKVQASTNADVQKAYAQAAVHQNISNAGIEKDLISADVQKANINADVQKAYAQAEALKNTISSNFQSVLVDADIQKTAINAGVDKAFAGASAEVAIANASNNYEKQLKDLMDELKKISNAIHHTNKGINRLRNNDQSSNFNFGNYDFGPQPSGWDNSGSPYATSNSDDWRKKK